MKRFTTYLMAGVIGILGVQEAQAATYINAAINLRAGPDTDYPSVVRLRRSSPVRVYGCVDDWYWCDVSSGAYRGWVRGEYIVTDYDNRRVQFVEAAPELNIPIINFDIGYWDAHYRSRPFYNDRSRWANHGWRDNNQGWHGRGNDAERDGGRDGSHDHDNDNDHGHDHDNDNDRNHGRWNRH